MKTGELKARNSLQQQPVSGTSLYYVAAEAEGELSTNKLSFHQFTEQFSDFIN